MKQYTGMRKGISLVEMMITVILFAVLSTIGLKYYRNFFDTGLKAQQTRVAAAMDQATQLANAYDVYTAQMGYEPTVISDLNATNARVLSHLPAVITELTNGVAGSGWDLNTSTGFGSGKAFMMTLDGNQTVNDDNQYCILWNHEFNKTLDMNATDLSYSPGAAADMAARGYTSFCYNPAGGAPAAGSVLRVMVIKP